MNLILRYIRLLRKIKLHQRSLEGWIILIAMIAMMLSACGEEGQVKAHRQVEKMRAKLLKSTRTKTAPLVLTAPQPVTYQSNELRSPFESAMNLNAVKDTTGKNPLQVYSINMLKFLGTMVKDNKQYAYLLAPDNKVYQVEQGDLVGDNGGKVTRIDQNSIVISTQQQETVLQLKDESE